MNRIMVQRCILFGVLVVLLGGIVVVTSAPSQETENTGTQEPGEPVLLNRPPEGYQVPARPAVTFPYTHISADRLRLANIQRVPDGEGVVFAGPDRTLPPFVSPDGQWGLSYRSSDIVIAQTGNAGTARVLIERDTNSDRSLSTRPIWSWDSSRVFYGVKRRHYTDEDHLTWDFEEWTESVDIATGEITRHSDIGYSNDIHTYATARYPDDPVTYHNREDKTDSVGTRDGTARWIIGHNARLHSLSPDKQMILAGNEGEHFRYLIYATDGSGLLHRFDMNDDPPEGNLRWSPDSTKFAYYQITERDGSGAPTASELYLMNIDGTGRTRITNTPDIPEGVVGWTPDGKLVFLHYKIDGGLYTADLVAK